MVYVALLRGINVGGNRKVDMKALKSVFEGAGMTAVATYINSGNVVFSAGRRAGLERRLEGAIAERFGFEVPLLVRDLPGMRVIAGTIPARWIDDAERKCDVLFLWPELDSPSILDKLPVSPGVDDVRYVSGAVIWGLKRKDLKRSGQMRLASAPLYKSMTIRNCNTTRKLVGLMEAAARSSRPSSS